MSQQPESERLATLFTTLNTLGRDMDMFITYLKRSLTIGVTTEDLESLITMIEGVNKEVQTALAILTGTTSIDYISARGIMEMVDELINQYSSSYEAITKALYTALVSGQATGLADVIDHAIKLKATINAIILKLLVLFPARERLTPPPLRIGYGMSEDVVRVLSILMARGELTKGEVKLLLNGDDERTEEVINELISRGFADRYYDPRHATVVLKYRRGSAENVIAKA